MSVGAPGTVHLRERAVAARSGPGGPHGRLPHDGVAGDAGAPHRGARAAPRAPGARLRLPRQPRSRGAGRWWRGAPRCGGGRYRLVDDVRRGGDGGGPRADRRDGLPLRAAAPNRWRRPCARHPRVPRARSAWCSSTTPARFRAPAGGRGRPRALRPHPRRPARPHRPGRAAPPSSASSSTCRITASGRAGGTASTCTGEQGTTASSPARRPGRGEPDAGAPGGGLNDRTARGVRRRHLHLALQPRSSIPPRNFLRFALARSVMKGRHHADARAQRPRRDGENPRLAPHLVASLDVDVPPHASVAVVTLPRSARPGRFRADLVLELRGRSRASIKGCHRPRGPAGRGSGQGVHVAGLLSAVVRAKKRCPTIALVVAPDAGVATRAAQPIDLGPGPRSLTGCSVLGPASVPEVTDPQSRKRRSSSRSSPPWRTATGRTGSPPWPGGDRRPSAGSTGSTRRGTFKSSGTCCESRCGGLWRSGSWSSRRKARRALYRSCSDIFERGVPHGELKGLREGLPEGAGEGEPKGLREGEPRALPRGAAPADHARRAHAHGGRPRPHPAMRRRGDPRRVDRERPRREDGRRRALPDAAGTSRSARHPPDARRSTARPGATAPGTAPRATRSRWSAGSRKYGTVISR